jgi:hypothetical protein
MASAAATQHARLPRVLLVAFVVLVLSEVVVRVRADALLEPDDWTIPEASFKEKQIDALAANGGASLVALGSSSIDVAFNPDQLTPGTSARPAYNAGIAGSSMAITAGWTEFQAVPRLKPDIAIVGITTREFNPNDSVTSNYTDEFIGSPKYRQASGTENAMERVERGAENASALFRYRTILRQPGYLWNLIGLGDAPVERGATRVSETGHKGIYVRATYTDKEAIYKGAALYRWEIGSSQRERLSHLLRYLRNNVAHVLVVNMPVSPVYVAWSPKGQADLDAVNALLRRLTAANDIEFLDAGVWPIELFADAGHVNGAGSKRFTEMIDTELQRLGWR